MPTPKPKPPMHYPFVPDWGDPEWFTFPACDGDGRRLGVQTYFIDGFLHGRQSGREIAFMAVVTDARLLASTLRFSFLSFAFFDCATGRYGTFTDFDRPHAPEETKGRLTTADDHLALDYRGKRGRGAWHNRRDPSGALVPFGWRLELAGTDHHGAPMALELEIDATRPPAPLGGRLLGGEMMFLGEPRTFSYFQSGLSMRGRLAWQSPPESKTPPIDEEVSGETGWIDRQWAIDDFSKHQDAQTARYRNEWRVIQLDSGWDMSCFHQFQRDRANAVVPWTGLSAQGPGPLHELRATHRVELRVPDFVRSPGIVRAPSMLSEGPRWFPRRYRLLAPEWDLDLECEPLIEAPAHRFPIEYWTGPVRVHGRLFGKPTSGVGFDERSHPRIRDFELAAALRSALDHGPDANDLALSRLALRVWEVEALLLRDDPAAAVDHLTRHVLPGLVGQKGERAERLRALAADVRCRIEERCTFGERTSTSSATAPTPVPAAGIRPRQDSKL